MPIRLIVAESAVETSSKTIIFTNRNVDSTTSRIISFPFFAGYEVALFEVEPVFQQEFRKLELAQLLYLSSVNRA
ncbi:Phoxy (PX) domain protein [Pyrenophora tritici-repentis]|nr:Phoxy (PX) domain protein [Pyrenophora tritici-repentis]